MRDHRNQFSIGLMCLVFSVSRSGFNSWMKRDHSQKETRKLKLVRAIEDIHKGSRKTYGSPRIFRMLKALGFQCSRSTVERLMKEFGIRSKTKRKFRVTTDSKHDLPVAENVLDRQFNISAPNKVWLADITYISTERGWLYLAAVLDAHTRKIVGWSMKERMTKDLVIDALEMAIKRQNPPRGLTHHSDRGSQYASAEYQKLLWRNGMISSMSRKGNCWDNAPMESFFHTLKTEHVYFERFKSKEEARRSIFDWIEIFYNRQRIHSSIGFLSPEHFERVMFAKVA